MAAASWQTENQQYLTAAVEVIRRRLEWAAAPEADRQTAEIRVQQAAQLCQSASDRLTDPSSLELIALAFGLSPFERDLLLLGAALELNGAIAPLCAALQGDSHRPYPTFSLALDCLPDPHWSALTPDAPLLRWRLLEVGTGTAFTTSPLRIDRRILNYLVGIDHIDERLRSLLESVPVTDDLVPSHRQIVKRIGHLWRPIQQGPRPVVQLVGADGHEKRAIAAAACHGAGLRLMALDANWLPATVAELDSLITLWEREAILGGVALLLECDGIERWEPGRDRLITQFIERVQGTLLVSVGDRYALSRRASLLLEVKRPDTPEQRQVWQQVLGQEATHLNGHLDPIMAQFHLSPTAIRSAWAEAAAAPGDRPLSDRIWHACRQQARPRLDDLAQRIDAIAQWDDLIVPEAQHRTLEAVAAHVRQRLTVYDTWGFRARGSRGLGISALFAGESGTGKTLAAEVLAHDLDLDLYRVDLSQVVSKYIGETEKNLRRVFDAAEEGGAVLLFDEADALFGKRSDVKDSHDRFANIEVSYLLQRMEAYRGLAILTTNMKNALDTAFLRRIRFVVQFPFPDRTHRAAIWGRIFPPETPTADLDLKQLARLNVTGGNIRNIALNAAFLAADARQPVAMNHLLYAAQGEYAKLDRPLTDAEVGGWV